MILVTLDMQIHMHQRANWKVKTHVEWHLITLIDGELMDLVTCRGKWSPYILYNAHTGCTRTCTYIYIQVYVLLRIWNIWQYDLLLKLSLTQLKTLSRGQNAVIINSNGEFQLEDCLVVRLHEFLLLNVILWWTV